MLSEDEVKAQQLQELDVLSSIYGPEELCVLNPEYPCIEMEVNMPIEAPDLIEGHNPIVILHATLPQDYPAALPCLELRGLDVFLPETSQAVLLELQKVAEENRGTPMLFAITTAFQDIFAKHSEAIRSKEFQQKEDERKRVEQAEQARFEGDRVTAEKFKKWKAAFLAEMAILKKTDTNTGVSSDRLTGRQLFLKDSSLAMSDLQLISEGEKVDIDESLFTEEVDEEQMDEEDED